MRKLAILATVSFAFAAPVAANEMEELRAASMKKVAAICHFDAKLTAQAVELARDGGEGATMASFAMADILEIGYTASRCADLKYYVKIS